jgi:hypothetical protein
VDGLRGTTAVWTTLPAVPDPAVLSVPAPELYALAARLDEQAGRADTATARLATADPGPGPLAVPASAALDAARTATTALAAELRALAGAVGAAADSWLGLDGSLLAPRGRAVSR